MTSAVRVDGERLYRKAQRGEQVERPERDVEIYRADLIATGEGTATFEIECSAGTYVRTLIEELDDAYCEALRRTAIGHLSLAPESAGEEDDRSGRSTSSLDHLPALELDPEAERLVRNGIRIEAPDEAPPDRGGPFRLVGEDGVVAVARTIDGRLVTEVVLP